MWPQDCSPALPQQHALLRSVEFIFSFCHDKVSTSLSLLSLLSLSSARWFRSRRWSHDPGRQALSLCQPHPLALWGENRRWYIAWIWFSRDDDDDVFFAGNPWTGRCLNLSTGRIPLPMVNFDNDDDDYDNANCDNHKYDASIQWWVWWWI